MSYLLATLCLNEMEWLPRLYAQHRDWPGMVRWVFVESADRKYAEANPTLVTAQGLSTDGTTEWLERLAKEDDRVTYIRHGFSDHSDPAQGKCQSRQRYLDVADGVRPKVIYCLDADEFYPTAAQRSVAQLINGRLNHFRAFAFRQRHIWHPRCLQQSRIALFSYEVVGGYWAVPHCRGWRWSPGLQYTSNHNSPCLNGNPLANTMKRFYNLTEAPECVHMGFAGDASLRIAKNRYYVTRGEGIKDHRQMYVACRAEFDHWVPSKTELAGGARVVPYTGLVPEVFRNLGAK